MITWILILALTGNGKAIHSLEFRGEAACLNARQQAVDAAKKAGFRYFDVAICVPKSL